MSMVSFTASFSSIIAPSTTCSTSIDCGGNFPASFDKLGVDFTLEIGFLLSDESI